MITFKVNNSIVAVDVKVGLESDYCNFIFVSIDITIKCLIFTK